MLIEFVADIAKLSLFVACAYVALNAYARRTRPDWTEHLTKRRLAVLTILTLAVSGVKVIEDVVAKESGPVDDAILWIVRNHVPSALAGFFKVVTLSGSATFLMPVALIAAVALLVAKRRFEALLLATSLITATLVVYALKTIVGRTRPALGETFLYWGSSFPSGHTLSTAAFSTAAALCLTRICLGPATWRCRLRSCRRAWSRSPVSFSASIGRPMFLAAMCLGAFIPLLYSVAFDFRRRNLSPRNHVA